MLRAPRRDRLTLRRRAVTVGALLVAGTTVAGCGASQSAETYHETARLQAARTWVGPIQVNNVYITAVGAAPSSLGSAALSLPAADVPIVSPSATMAPSSAAGAGAVSGYLVATITNVSNTTADRVISATVGAPTPGPGTNSTGASPTASSPANSTSSSSAATGSGGTVTLAPPGANTRVPANGALLFHDPAATSQGPFLVVTGFTQPLRVGTYVPVTFTLAGAGQTSTMLAPVVYSYAGTPPASPPVPTGSATPSTSKSAKGTSTPH